MAEAENSATAGGVADTVASSEPHVDVEASRSTRTDVIAKEAHDRVTQPTPTKTTTTTKGGARSKAGKRASNARTARLPPDLDLAFRRVAYLRQLSRVVPLLVRGSSAANATSVCSDPIQGDSLQEPNAQKACGSTLNRALAPRFSHPVDPLISLSAFYGAVSNQVERKLVLNVDPDIKRENCPKCRVSRVPGVTFHRKIKGLRNVPMKSYQALSGTTLVGAPFDDYDDPFGIRTPYTSGCGSDPSRTVTSPDNSPAPLDDTKILDTNESQKLTASCKVNQEMSVTNDATENIEPAAVADSSSEKDAKFVQPQASVAETNIDATPARRKRQRKRKAKNGFTVSLYCLVCDHEQRNILSNSSTPFIHTPVNL